MKLSTYAVRTSSLCLVIIGAAIGCSKKEDAPVVVPADTNAPAAAASSAAVDAAAAAEAQRAFAEADAALKAREYQKAVEAMLLAQRQRYNAQQAAQARNKMVELQSALAGAAASGDANAKAAIQRLRQSATH